MKHSTVNNEDNQVVDGCQIPNSRADEFNDEANIFFKDVNWECVTGDFWTTFTVWSVFDTDESREEVEKFVVMADDFMEG